MKLTKTQKKMLKLLQSQLGSPLWPHGFVLMHGVDHNQRRTFDALCRKDILGFVPLPWWWRDSKSTVLICLHDDYIKPYGQKYPDSHLDIHSDMSLAARLAIARGLKEWIPDRETFEKMYKEEGGVTMHIGVTMATEKRSKTVTIILGR
jgi:hypothetical protein